MKIIDVEHITLRVSSRGLGAKTYQCMSSSIRPAEAVRVAPHFVVPARRT